VFPASCRQETSRLERIRRLPVATQDQITIPVVLVQTGPGVGDDG
jgi:hypothetical protein